MPRLFGLFKRENVCTLLDTLQGRHAERYQRFRDLLQSNHRALDVLAEMEEACHAQNEINSAMPDILQRRKQRCSAV
jgi:hypothetical protein